MYQVSTEDRLQMISGQQDELRGQAAHERMANEPSAKAAFRRSRVRRVESAGSHHLMRRTVHLLHTLTATSGTTRTPAAR
jgi:hypothetical protein